MQALLGFELDFWDYLTFLTLALVVVSVVVAYVWLAGLPGRIAIARKHPEAEAVKLLGWAGLLPTIYPWVQAFIWAFKPTNIIDIRRFPRGGSKGHRRGHRPPQGRGQANARRHRHQPSEA